MPSAYSTDSKSKSLALLVAYQQQPSVRLRNRLIQMNIGLVRQEAHRLLHTSSETFDDLMQIGSLGLLKAVERFDVTKGYAFSSFAIPFVRGEIKHYLRDHSTAVRIPRRWQSILHQSGQAIRQLSESLQRPPSDQEVADQLDISIEEWQQARIASGNRSPLSLDIPSSSAGPDAAPMGELLCDPRYHSFQLAQEDKSQLQRALAQLEQRTRQIVESVYLQERTQVETAEILGMSPSTVRNKLRRGLMQLRLSMRPAG